MTTTRRCRFLTVAILPAVAFYYWQLAPLLGTTNQLIFGARGNGNGNGNRNRTKTRTSTSEVLVDVDVDGDGDAKYDHDYDHPRSASSSVKLSGPGIIYHVGPPKTASTSIQAYGCRHSDDLWNDGVAFMGLADNNPNSTNARRCEKHSMETTFKQYILNLTHFDSCSKFSCILLD